MNTGKPTTKLSLLFFVLASSLGGSENSRMVLRTMNGDEIIRYENSSALVIGVSDYNNGWQRLPHAVREAEAVADALERRGFIVRTSYNPTSDELKEVRANSMNGTGGGEDRLIVYFAGHGETIVEQDGDESHEQGYIVPVDAPKLDGNTESFLEKAVSMKSIAVAAANSTVKHALFMFDCCFSGAILSGEWNKTVTDSQSLIQPVRQFITAGGKDEEVPARSIFNYCLLQALDGDADLNGDGFITATELSVYLQDNVIQRSRNTLHSQYGRIMNPENNSGDFVFRLEPLVPLIQRQQNEDPKSERSSINLPVFCVEDDFKSEIPELEFTYIPSGRFVMGSPYSEVGRDDDEGPQREVYVKAFEMQICEVTQLQWNQVMGYNPSFLKGDSLPVEQVSWNQVQEFIRRLNAVDPGKCYRLPSEAEWEYACRAGSDTRFPWGDDPEYYALEMFSWTSAGFTGRTYPVGRKRPNSWGLYDMHGNVFEWCQDWYRGSYEDAPTDGSVMQDPVGSHRVYRGGGSVISSWEYNARRCRSAYRNRGRPTSRYFDVGFRLVKDA